MSRLIVAKLTVAYLIFLFGVTLGGFYHPGAIPNLVPFHTMEHDIRKGGWEFLINFVGNVVVTLPVGWIVPFFLGRRCGVWKVTAAGMMLSSTIEILQGLSRRRVADVDDVILNTIGGLLGYAAWVGVDWWVQRSRRIEAIGETSRGDAELRRMT